MNPDWLSITSGRSSLAVARPLNLLLYLCQFLALQLKRLVVVSPGKEEEVAHPAAAGALGSPRADSILQSEEAPLSSVTRRRSVKPKVKRESWCGEPGKDTTEPITL